MQQQSFSIISAPTFITSGQTASIQLRDALAVTTPMAYSLTFYTYNAAGVAQAATSWTVQSTYTGTSGQFEVDTSLNGAGPSILSITRSGVRTVWFSLVLADVPSSVGALTVNGDLTVNGTKTTFQATTLTTTDNLARIGAGNSGDAIDLGMYGTYTDSSGSKLSGLIRKANTKKYALFQDISGGTDSSSPALTIPLTSSNYAGLGVSSLDIVGSASTSNIASDISGALVVSGSSKVRLTAPTEWRYITSDVSASSLTLSTTSYGTLYRITTTSFNSLTIPTQSSADSGAFWELFNNTTSTISITVTGGIGVSSPLVLTAASSCRLYRNGSSHYFIGKSSADGSTWSSYTATQDVDMNLKALTYASSLAIAHRSTTDPLTSTGDTATSYTALNGDTWRVHTWTGSGSFVCGTNLSVQVLVVGGGGGGGNFLAGGGGGGGLVYNASKAITPGTYTVTVGAGGAGSLTPTSPGGNGGNSSALGITAFGGGGGGSINSPAGGSGGCGGGGWTPGTGSQGGNGNSGVGFGGGGGGGASGSPGVSPGTVQRGQDGLAFSISGSSVTYAGGGGGWNDSGMATASNNAGGAGGGGAGGVGSMTSGSGAANAVNGTDGLGGGGGGTDRIGNGGNGGCGVVIIAYNMAGAASTSTVGTLTSDASGALVVSGSTRVKLSAPTEWRYLCTDVSTTSLTLSTSSYTGLYRITNTAFTSITVPSQTAADSGAFWELLNSTANPLVINFTGAVGFSTYTIAAGTAAKLVWNGAMHIIFN